MMSERRYIRKVFCLVFTRFGVEILPMQSASVAARTDRDEHKRQTLIGNTLDSHLGAENADLPVKPSSIIGAKFVLVRRFRNHFPSTCDVVGWTTGKWLSSNFAQIRKLAPRSSSLRAISRISSHSGQFHFPVRSPGPSDYLKPESGLGRGRAATVNSDCDNDFST